MSVFKSISSGLDNKKKFFLTAGRSIRHCGVRDDERVTLGNGTRLENDAAFLKSWQLCLSFNLDVLTT